MKKGSHHSPEAKEKNRQKHMGKTISPVAIEINRARFLANNPMKRDEVKDMARERMKTNNPMFNPATREQMRQTKLGGTLSEDHKENIRIGTKEALADPEVRQRMSESKIDVPRPQWVKDKISAGTTGIQKSDEHKKALSEVPRTDEWIQKNRETNILAHNEIWYGGVKYPEDKNAVYCEKWNKGLRNRIRTFWEYKSALSGKTKDDNSGKDLDCHHIYYQKKACCQWDEDAKGYYVWIEGEKYYIKGDPNKFVPLTREEHTRTLYNKIYWIRLFEDIIESRGGKSYFTKEEMKEFKTRK